MGQGWQKKMTCLLLKDEVEENTKWIEEWPSDSTIKNLIEFIDSKTRCKTWKFCMESIL